jgi:phenylalanyl-tRNA synthetase beta chain
MLLSREWLNEYTKVTVPDRDFSERMTMSGSKVEGYEVTGDEISSVVVGKVLEMERHPDSDHMWVCRVDVGAEVLTIVTGAQNVSVGDMVPAALDGSTLPGGVEIHTGKLRGVESQGMLCSLKELGLDTHDFPDAIEDGIWIITDPCDAGEDIKKVAGLGDSVVEFEITNNRADCLSMIGLAREAAATFGAELTLPSPSVKNSDGDISDWLSVDIKDSKLCPRYTAI